MCGSDALEMMTERHRWSKSDLQIKLIKSRSPGFLLSSQWIRVLALCPLAARTLGVHTHFCNLYSSVLYQKDENFQRNSLRQRKTSGTPLQSLPCHPHMGWTPHCAVKNLNLFLTTKQKHFRQKET